MLPDAVLVEEWQLSVTDFICAHLAERDLLKKLDSLSEKDVAEVEVQYLYLMEQLLQRLKLLSEIKQTSLASMSEEGVEKLEAMINMTNSAMDNLNRLLSIQSFVSVISQLFKSPLPHIRRKALQLFIEKVTNEGQQEEANTVKTLLSTLPILEQMVVSTSKRTGKNVSSEDEVKDADKTLAMVFDGVAALAKALLRSTAVDSKKDFSRILAVVTETLHARLTSGACLWSTKAVACGLECMGIVCEELGMHSLAQLSSMSTLVLDVLQKTLNTSIVTAAANLGADEQLEVEREQRRLKELQSSSLGALNCITVALPKFLSPYLERILGVLFHPALDDPSETDTLATGEDQSSAVYVSATLVALAEEIEARILLPCIYSSLPSVLNHGDRSTKRLFWFLGTICGNFTTEIVQNEFKSVFKFLLRSFDIRRTDGDKFEKIADVEESVCTAAMRLIIKLKESQLKSLFLKMLEWLNFSPTGVADGSDDVVLQKKIDKNLDRCVVFFRLVDHLISTLKGIFVPYFGYLMDHVVLMLQASPLTVAKDEEDSDDERARKKRKKLPENSKHVQLRCLVSSLILSSLKKSFACDTESFFSKTYFDKLTKPICLQVCDF
jgi:hypothetical protein